MSNKVTVLGSLNVDTILRIPRLPQPGETLKMDDIGVAGGGKGANQAISAARSKSHVTFIGGVGNDIQGEMMLKLLKEDGININNVAKLNEGTGQAFILLQESGENSIVIYGGANQAIKTTVIQNAMSDIKDSDFLVAQFETPLEVTNEAFKLARELNVKTILNPAPATDILDELKKNIDLIIPNETEAELLTGIKVVDEDTCRQAADKLIDQGINNVIITLGKQGAYYKTKDGICELVPAFKVEAVDTTAAGDTFIGALVSKLDTSFSNLREAIIYASKASSLAVQRLGAIPSIPYKDDVEKQLNSK